MRKLINITFIMLIVIASGGCKKNEIITYQEKPAVYFSNFQDGDSLVYSFIGKSGPSDTLYLDMKLLGDNLSTTKKYKVEVNETETTAKEGLHYKKLDEYYTFPQDVFLSKLPIIIYNTDEALKTKSVSLTLSIKSTDDINAGYPTKINAHIIITNQLVKPNYWDGLLVIFYGEYSKVKHSICIQLQGKDFPTTESEATSPPYGISYLMSYGRVAAKYFTDHIVYDENENRILPWAAL